MSPQLSKGSRNVTLVSVSIFGFLRVRKEPLVGEIVGNGNFWRLRDVVCGAGVVRRRAGALWRDSLRFLWCCAP